MQPPDSADLPPPFLLWDAHEAERRCRTNDTVQVWPSTGTAQFALLGRSSDGMAGPSLRTEDGLPHIAFSLPSGGPKSWFQSSGTLEVSAAPVAQKPAPTGLTFFLVARLSRAAPRSGLRSLSEALITFMHGDSPAWQLFRDSAASQLLYTHRYQHTAVAYAAITEVGGSATSAFTGRFEVYAVRISFALPHTITMWSTAPPVAVTASSANASHGLTRMAVVQTGNGVLQGMALPAQLRTVYVGRSQGDGLQDGEAWLTGNIRELSVHLSALDDAQVETEAAHLMEKWKVQPNVQPASVSSLGACRGTMHTRAPMLLYSHVFTPCNCHLLHTCASSTWPWPGIMQGCPARSNHHGTPT